MTLSGLATRRDLRVAALPLLALACFSAPERPASRAALPTTAQVARAAVESARIPSISYAQLRGGRIDEVATLGTADLETRRPATSATLYEAASLTKPVIALLCLQLVDAGVLTLDEPVAAAVPAPRVVDRDRYQGVTARHLLSHSAGFPNWSGSSLEPGRTDALPFEFEPGSAFSYSGEGYALLGSFLEAKSGRSLVDLSDALFASLGMKLSSLVGAHIVAPVARGHFGQSPDREARLLDEPVPAFSMMTNAEEYGALLAFIAGGAGLSPALVAESRRTHARVEPKWYQRSFAPEQIGWSLGWGVLERDDGPVFFQWGDNGAFRAFAAYRAPETEAPSGLVFFVNGSRGLLETTALARPVLGDISTASGWFSSAALESVRRWIRF